jgi:hypothetical protein
VNATHALDHCPLLLINPSVDEFKVCHFALFAFPSLVSCCAIMKQFQAMITHEQSGKLQFAWCDCGWKAVCSDPDELISAINRHLYDNHLKVGVEGEAKSPSHRSLRITA